jgi:hypothetical protein
MEPKDERQRRRIRCFAKQRDGKEAREGARCKREGKEDIEKKVNDRIGV